MNGNYLQGATANLDKLVFDNERNVLLIWEQIGPASANNHTQKSHILSYLKILGGFLCSIFKM